MQLDTLDLDGVTLLDGERVRSALNLEDGTDRPRATGSEVLLLTDRRVIQFAADGRSSNTAFLSLQDVEAVDITSLRTGGWGAYVWGALAFVVAVMVWVSWDNAVGSFLVSATVALMGLWLVIDRATTPGALQATFKSGATEISCGINGNTTPEEAQQFVNRLFELKDKGLIRTFIPR